MKPYLSYKESGIEWIGEIPNYWVHSKLGYVLESNDGGVWGEDTESDDEGVFVFRSTEITVDGKWDLSNPTRRNLVYREIEKAKLKEGDLVITKSSGSQNHIGKTSLVNKEIEKMNVCFSNFVQRIHPKQKVESKFLHYILNSYLVREQYRFQSETTTGLSNLNSDSINNLIISVPPLSEQQQIVSYLDHKTKKIDELIEKTEQKIELLKEKRTSLINHCVTKGLNPNVEMKNSGVEWIGEIPSHWEVKRLKHLCGYNLDSLGNETKSDYELDYIEISDVDSFGNINNPTHYQYSKSPSRCRRKIKKNDIIISTVRTYLKAIGLIEDEVSDLICSTGFCVITPNEEIIPKILFYLVRSEWFVAEVISLSEGVSYPSIQSEKLTGIKVVLPPKSEQEQIIEYLDKKAQEIDILIDKENKRIDLLKECRQSLISEVVTGKIDVRDEVVV